MIALSEVNISRVEVAESFYTIVQTKTWININEVISETMSHTHDVTWKDHNEGYIKLPKGEAVAIGLKIVERNEGHECDGRPLGRTRSWGSHFDIYGCKWVVEVSVLTVKGTRNAIMRFTFTFPMQTRYPDSTQPSDAKAEHKEIVVNALNNELEVFNDFLTHYIERITTS